MTRKGVWTQAALAAAALVAAYVTWHRPAVGDAGDVVALDVSRRQLEKIRYDDGERWVELVPAEAGFAIRTSGRPAVMRDTPDKGKVEAQPATPERELRANDKVDEALDQLVPLHAVRALGKLPETKLKELGFPDAKRHLTIRASGVDHVFTISTAVGSSTPYLRRDADGEVFILNNSVLGNVENQASRLVDRRVHPFGKLQPGDSIVLTAKNQRAEWNVLPGEQPDTTTLARVGSAQPDGFGRNWNEKLTRILVMELLGKGEVPVGGEPQVELRVEYRRRGTQLGFLELGHAAGVTYMRSENTPSWAKPAGQGADEALLELANILKGS